MSEETYDPIEEELQAMLQSPEAYAILAAKRGAEEYKTIGNIALDTIHDSSLPLTQDHLADIIADLGYERSLVDQAIGDLIGSDRIIIIDNDILTLS